MQEVLKRILVTGGNQGIGFVRCKFLILENGCYVYIGSRNKERGIKAFKDLGPECEGKVWLIEIDVTDDISVKKASEDLKSILGENTLYALVNNTGTGLKHGGSAKACIHTKNNGV